MKHTNYTTTAILPHLTHNLNKTLRAKLEACRLPRRRSRIHIVHDWRYPQTYLEQVLLGSTSVDPAHARVPATG